MQDILVETENIYHMKSSSSIVGMVYVVRVLDWGYFVTLIGGNKYREYEVMRDDELINQLLRLPVNFGIINVLVGYCPPVDELRLVRSF
jgi:predicted phage-related endonuclease